MRCYFSVLLIVLIAGGCTKATTSAPEPGPAYLTTLPPFEAVLTPIVGSRASVRSLLAAGATPHTHDPRPSDVRQALSSTALFFGAEDLDGWAAALDAPTRIALLDLLPDSLRRAFPDDHAGAPAAESHDHGPVDPHFWTDPLAVRALVPVLRDTLCALDADGCGGYHARADRFAHELDSLHASLTDLLAPLADRPVVLAHPFLLYFLARYDIPVAGIIETLPGKEATPRTLQRLAEQLQATDAVAILTLAQMPPNVARVLAEATGLPVVSLDPMGRPGTSYTELLRTNAHTLHDVLQ